MKNKGKILIFLFIIMIFTSSNIYGYNNTKIEEFNQIITINDTIEISGKELKINTRNGDTNIGNGGGNGELGGSVSDDTKVTGTERDEGVRVTLVDAKTGKVLTRPLDLANNPMPATRWFGAVSKMSYLGIGNNKVELNITDNYTFKKPDKPLPKIIGGDLATIKRYFGSEKFANYFSNLTGFNYKELISGDYKLILEPIGYPKISGKYVACSSTELALFDQKKSGGIRKKLLDFSHRKLPLAMFLEKDDFGIKSYTGDPNARQNNKTIINQLGVGIVKFKEEEKEPDIEKFDYTYRTDTDVITSIKVSGGESNPDQPMTVYFEILGKKYQVNNVFYPNGESQLAWVKWTTPKEPQEIEIPVTIVKEHLDPPPSVCNPSNDPPRPKPTITETTIKVKIAEIVEKTPPDPDADDRWGGYQKFNVYDAEKNIPKLQEVKENKWGIWSASWHSNPVRKGCEKYCEGGEDNRDDSGSGSISYCSHGSLESHYYTEYYTIDEGWWEYEYNEKYAKLKIDHLITSDKYNPTAKRKGKEIKSAYGVDQFLDSKILSNDTSNVTPIQNGVSLFPDFHYKNYFRVLEMTKKMNSTSKLEFKPNRYSTLKSRTHFTPIWYPDKTNYNVYTYAFDAWTPAGMLSINLLDGVYVDGDMWDDWTVRPLPID